jgi:hypothetical protein
LSITNFIKNAIFGKSKNNQKTKLSSSPLSKNDDEVVIECIKQLLKVFNESSELAKKSKNSSTKLSRLNLAEETLKKLRFQSNQFSIPVNGLDNAETEINKIRNDIEVQDDVIESMEFCATMQLRTPLRILLKHGEVHTDKNSEPPKIVNEIWEGHWMPKLKTWRDLGFNIDELPESTLASHIGQVKEEDYLPFLLAVRKIVELNEPIDSRIKLLREYPMVGIWRTCVESHDGIENIINQLFPRFIDTLPKLNAATITELSSLNLNTATKIAMTSNEVLLSIKGLGQAKLKTLREYCNTFYSNRDNERIENVIR